MLRMHIGPNSHLEKGPAWSRARGMTFRLAWLERSQNSDPEESKSHTNRSLIARAEARLLGQVEALRDGGYELGGVRGRAVPEPDPMLGIVMAIVVRIRRPRRRLR